MARLRQTNPQSYGSSSKINAEFESLIRYINAGELGDKTLGELLAVLFNSDGEFAGPIEMRKDSSLGIQFRVGTYADAETGWQTLVALSELRGAAGSDTGEIGAPIILGRADYVATSGQTVFDYAHTTSDDLIVYRDGVLKRPGASFDYVASTTAGTGGTGAVTFNSGVTVGNVISIYKIRSSAITGFTRSDQVTSASQQVFPFTFESTSKLQVYKNGILQREGGSNDYILDAAQNQVVMNSAVASGNTITIITVENTSVSAVSGMMFEDNYVIASSGLIDFTKVSVGSGAITQAKVSGLTAALAASATISISSSTPVAPATGSLWLDTSQNPNKLKFYTGAQFLEANPESSLPTFSTSNASQFIRVNSTGTALEYSAVDLTSVVPVTQKGAANGVAQLDSSGRLPFAQLPTVLGTSTFYDTQASVANGSVDLSRLWKQKVRIDGIAVRTSTGTCTIQIRAGGVDVGSTFSVSSTPNEVTLGTPIEIDATTSSKQLGYTITSNSAGNDLEVSLAASVISS